jgi:hypothetical protein
MKRTKIIALFAVVLLLALQALAGVDALKVRVTATLANLRERPDLASSTLQQVRQGTVFDVIEKTGDWYRITFVLGGIQLQGYLHKTVVEEIAGDAPPVQKPTPAVQKPAPQIPAEQQIRPAAPALTGPFKRFFVSLDFLMGFSKESQSLPFSRTVYYETAPYGLEYALNKSQSFGATLGFHFSPSLGIALAVSSTSRTIDETTTMSVPHPLWPESHRSGELKDTSQKLSELDIALNLFLSLRFGPLGLSLFGGPCYMMSKATLVSDLAFTEQGYPYLEVSLTQSTASLTSNVIGFNAGAEVGYYLGRSLELFAGGKFVGGTAKFKPGTDVPELSIALGGLRAGAGLKLFF